MNVKITKLTGSNIAALEKYNEDLKIVALSKSAVEFAGTAKEASSRVRQAQEKAAETGGRKGGAYASLHAVARKLENGPFEEITTDENPASDAPTEETPDAPKLQLVADSTDKASLKNIPGLNRPVPEVLRGKVVTEEDAIQNATEAADAILANAGYSKQAKQDKPIWGTGKTHHLHPGDLFLFYGQNRDKPKAEPTVRTYKHEMFGGVATRFWAAPIVAKADQPEKAAPAKKDAPAKQAASRRTIPAEATNKARQAWIEERGIEEYRKQYNGGWDNATYGQGEKKAKSGEATPAWMDGYTDRKANPGKEGIPAKWSALKSSKAPVAKV